MRSAAKCCEVAEAHAVLPLQQAAGLPHGRTPAIIGGELALSVRNLKGRGGRRYDSAPAPARDRTPKISALAADTDGIDGSIDGGEATPTDAVGDHHRGDIEATTLARVRHLDAKNFLHNNNATSFFEAAGGSLVRGRSHQRQ
jgi:hydroxypyruvate reductase